MRDGILATIGKTPLVALRHFLHGARFRLFAKLEAPNPGGSIKDRAALNILLGAMCDGKLGRRTVVVESSSGNMGIGLAQACAYLGVRFICVVDPRTTAQNVAIMRAYGAETEVVETPAAGRGGFVQARIDRVRELAATLPNVFWPDQYSNINNALAHRETMREITSALDGAVDYLFCPTSTCGTIRGCSDYVREQGLPTKIIAVDALGSAIFDDREMQDRAITTRRLIPGHGSAVRPALYRSDVADVCLRVSDLDCVVGCRRLVAEEGILAGGSSGAAAIAVERLRHSIAPGANCVAIFPDRGERYLDTIYSDQWVTAHFGDVAELWDGGALASRAWWCAGDADGDPRAPTTARTRAAHESASR
jgi:2,3-diaminopropionate biosynthesis protein SbnA